MDLDSMMIKVSLFYIAAILAYTNEDDLYHIPSLPSITMNI